MRRIIMAAGLAALLAVPATSADACCKGRKTTGTAIGAVAGGLLGNAVASGGGKTGGTLIGAGLGAVVGHEVAKGGCTGTRTYRSARTTSRSSYARANDPYRYASNSAYRSSCHYESRPFYNERGELVYSPTRICR